MPIWLISSKSIINSISECFLFIALKKRDVSTANIYIARLLLLINHLYTVESIMAPKQILVEHLLQCFSIKTFAHLKWPVAVNLLHNFWATFENYHLCHMFAISRLNHHIWNKNIKNIPVTLTGGLQSEFCNMPWVMDSSWHMNCLV